MSNAKRRGRPPGRVSRSAELRELDWNVLECAVRACYKRNWTRPEALWDVIRRIIDDLEREGVYPTKHYKPRSHERAVRRLAKDLMAGKFPDLPPGRKSDIYKRAMAQVLARPARSGNVIPVPVRKPR